MYIKVGRGNRRGRGLGWTGGFTFPGGTTQYTQQKCTGSADRPMTGGDLACGMPGEIEYLQRIGCTAVGFQGQHQCLTGAGNQGIFFCCPEGVLQQALTGQPLQAGVASGLIGGISTTQILGFAGVAAVIGGLAYFMWRKDQKEEMLHELGY